MKIERVIFLHSYAQYKGIGVDEGVEFLRRFGVSVEQYVPAPGFVIQSEPPLSRQVLDEPPAGLPAPVVSELSTRVA